MASKTTYALEVELGASANSSYYRNLNSAADGMQGLNRTASRVAAAITAAFAAVNITRAISDAVETYAGFEQEMANAAAISNASSAEYEQMEKAALAAGRSTVYTATQSAEALGFMSLAGWDVNTSVTALVPVLRYATATGAELETASDLITDSMSALKLEVGELDGYLDKMIAANNNANTTAEDLTQALIKTGGASRTLGADLDDTITALGVLANNGTKGEEAGTALNSILTRIASNDTALKELKRIGAYIFDENGAFIGLEESLIAINNAMADFSDEQRSLTLKAIAGTNRYSQMKYLIDSVTDSAETGTSAWRELSDEVGNSTGALDRMYATTTDTFENAKAILGSAQEDMKIRLVDVFSDDAKDFVLWLAEKLPDVTDSLVAFAETHKGDFADALETAGTAIEKAWDIGVTAGTWIINHKGVLVGSLTAIATAFGLLKAINIGSSIAGFLGSLGPAGLAVAGISLAAGAIIGIASAIEQAEEKAKEANLAEHFGKISLSLSELDTLARQIVGEDSLNGIAAMLEAAGNAADSLDNITSIWSDLQKEDWKINVGFNLSKEDYKAYASDLESYVSGVEKYAADKGYEVHLSTALLFGEGSEQDIVASTFFASIQEQIEAYGNELYDYLYNETNGALLDGIVDINEEQIVQEYLTKINAITSALAEAESQAKFDALTLKYNGADLDAISFAQLQEEIGAYVEEASEGARSAYESAMSEYRARLALDDTYTQEMFDADAAAAEESYYRIQADAAMNGMNYVLDSIHEAYPELQDGLEQYQSDLAAIYSKYTDPEMEEYWSKSPYTMISNMKEEALEALRNSNINGDRGAISELLAAMQPTAQLLDSSIRALGDIGAELPEAMAGFSENWQLMNDLADGSWDAAGIDVTNMLVSEDSFNDFLYDMGLEIDETHSLVMRKIEDTYQDGFDVSTDLRVDLDVSTSGLKATSALAFNNVIGGALSDRLKIYANADGGIYNSPILTTFAENGPEAAVPLDGSDRAKSLWLQAGQILGMFQGGAERDRMMYQAISATPESGGSEIKLIYNPVVNISGNASEKDVQNAISATKEELAALIDEIMEEKKRVSFN